MFGRMISDGMVSAVRVRAVVCAVLCAGLNLTAGCATKAPPPKESRPVQVADTDPRGPLVAAGLHSCQQVTDAATEPQCQSLVYSQRTCEAAELELKAQDCCAKTFGSGRSEAFQLIFCERRQLK